MKKETGTQHDLLNANNACHIPVVGYMVQDENGNWHMDKERSQWADIPADAIARYLIEHMGGHIPEIACVSEEPSCG